MEISQNMIVQNYATTFFNMKMAYPSLTNILMDMTCLKPQSKHRHDPYMKCMEKYFFPISNLLTYYFSEVIYCWEINYYFILINWYALKSLYLNFMRCFTMRLPQIMTLTSPIYQTAHERILLILWTDVVYFSKQNILSLLSKCSWKDTSWKMDRSNVFFKTIFSVLL